MLQRAYVEWDLAEAEHAGNAEVAFLAKLPPLGYSVYRLHPAPAPSHDDAHMSTERQW